MFILTLEGMIGNLSGMNRHSVLQFTEAPEKTQFFDLLQLNALKFYNSNIMQNFF